MIFLTMLKQPSDFLPGVMSLAALAIVLVHLVTRFGCMSKRSQKL